MQSRMSSLLIRLTHLAGTDGTVAGQIPHPPQQNLGHFLLLLILGQQVILEKKKCSTEFHSSVTVKIIPAVKIILELQLIFAAENEPQDQP